MENHKLVTTIILILLAASGLYYFTIGKERVRISEINSYQECADAGYPIMESYPEQCATPDGRSFVRVLGEDEVTIPPPVVGEETSGIQGKVWLGPTCPVVQNPPESECADRAFQTSLALYSSTGALIRSFSSGADGAFSISVVPGKYKIGPVPGNITMPSCQETAVIEVNNNLYTQTEVQCDSGIR